jgi:hypothetical protein
MHTFQVGYVSLIFQGDPSQDEVIYEKANLGWTQHHTGSNLFENVQYLQAQLILRNLESYPNKGKLDH